MVFGLKEVPLLMCLFCSIFFWIHCLKIQVLWHALKTTWYLFWKLNERDERKKKKQRNANNIRQTRSRPHKSFKQIHFRLQCYNKVNNQGSYVCGRIWSKLSLMGDRREDWETADLVFPSVGIPLWTGSWQDKPRRIEMSSVSQLTWEIVVAQVAGKRTQRGCRVQQLSHWGVKIGTVWPR